MIQVDAIKGDSSYPEVVRGFLISRGGINDAQYNLANDQYYFLVDPFDQCVKSIHVKSEFLPLLDLYQVDPDGFIIQSHIE